MFWRVCAGTVIALALAGCASLGEGADPPPADSSTVATQTDPTAATAFELRVEADDQALRELVERHTVLRQYQALTDLDPSEARRLMVLAERDARQLLATQGHFSPRVTVRREDARGAQPGFVIAFEPGPTTTVRQVDITFEGDIAASRDPQAIAQREAITSDWSLDTGRRFTQERWDEAKTGALRELVARRYPKGRISHSVADIDAPAAQATLGLRLDSGPPFHLGRTTVQGASRYPPELAERLSWLRPGDVYDQKKLVDAQQQLAVSGYYDSAYFSIDPEGDPAAVPVTVAVTEAKRHKVQLGAGLSTDSGPRLTFDYRDNTALGTTWRADGKFNLDRKQPLLQLELTSLPDTDGSRRAALARTMRQDDGVLSTLSKTVRVGLIKTEERYERNVYLQYERATVSGSGTAALAGALLGDGAAISLNYAWTSRQFDQMPVPRGGHGLSLELGAGLTTLGPRKPFARIDGRWLGILPVGGGASRVQLRAEAAAVLASERARLPSTYLFRTGGDTTVRGYAYRSIGVPVGDDLVAPGRYLAVASAEWQRPILQERYPGLLEHVLFVDVGSVANRAQDLRPRWGVGTGVRLITPVGPMELALAYGLKTRRFRLHLNVGFVF